MRVRRGLLFWGLFLIPIGAVPLLARAGLLPADQLADAWRLWPLVLIVIGLAVVVSRSRASVLATVAAALVFGSLAGAAMAAGPVWIDTVTSCSVLHSSAATPLDRSGTLSGVPSVRLDLRCGTVDLGSGASGGWRLSGSYRGAQPVVTASSSSLAIRAPDGTVREDWQVELSPGAVQRLDLTANASSATIRLGGLQLGDLAATLNAGDLRIDTAEGSVDRVAVTVNAGRVRLIAGSSPLSGTITANAGGIDLCVAPTAGLRLTVTDQITFSHNLSSRGLTKGADGAWVRPATGDAPIVALRIEGNAAALALDPDGGCR